MFCNVAEALLADGKKDKALEILDMCQENVPEENFPLESIPLGFSTNDYMVIRMVRCYYGAGAPEKARDLAVKIGDDLVESARFYLEFYDYARHDFDLCGQYIYYLADILRKNGDKEIAQQLEDNFELLIRFASGSYEGVDSDTLSLKKNIR